MFSTSQFAIGVSARSLTVVNDPRKQLSIRCALLVSNGPNQSFIETDRTEFSEDCLNPDWSKRFIISFKFCEIKTLRFDTYLSLNKIGETIIPLVELLSAKDGFTMEPIKSGNDKIGKLLISYRECENMVETITMQFSGKDLDKKDLFGLSDPYLVISNIDSNGNITEVYKSEVVKQNVNPVWKPIKLRARSLCQSNHKMKLKFDCFDWNCDFKIGSKTVFIGSFMTSVDQLLNGTLEQNRYELINANKFAQNSSFAEDSYRNSGLIFLETISISYGESFLDYIRNGLQFHVSIGIDFTSALSLNTESTDSHIFKQIVRSFSDILKQYNKQNIWTAFGFNGLFKDNEDNDNSCYEFKPNGFYESIEHLIKEFDSLLTSTKELKTKSKSIEQIVNQTIDLIEKLEESDPKKKSRYSVLLILTSNLAKYGLKNLDDIIEKTNAAPISVLVIDVDLSGSNKDLKDIKEILDQNTQLDNRNNIEVISIQSLQQCNDRQNLVNKTVKDIVNRIPDQFMKYLSFIKHLSEKI